MNKEEQILKNRFGNDNHFTVPEGYFEQFAQQLMEQLPEREARVIKMQPNLWHRLRPAILAAACLAGVVFSVGIYQKSGKQVPADMVAQMDVQGYIDLDEAADYMMLDNDDIYAYMAGDYQ